MQRVVRISISRRGAPEPAESIAIGRRLIGGCPAFSQPGFLERSACLTVLCDLTKLGPLPDEERMTLTAGEHILLRLRAHLTSLLAGGEWDLGEIAILTEGEGNRLLAALTAAGLKAEPTAGTEPNDDA